MSKSFIDNGFILGSLKDQILAKNNRQERCQIHSFLISVTNLHQMPIAYNGYKHKITLAF